ncbi:hypothetical protein EDL96_09760 [Kocuria soli]|uniref:Uncharacterized protein n=1 Tax=Kocuria soli TaxID=2485125 RepID=A0A3N3ZNM0_9MICC|nr:hypothetical protein [Kocuria soli]ROZ62466.1 hypothetical protein EDL96_09760 [Kocuria soli]
MTSTRHLRSAAVGAVAASLLLTGCSYGTGPAREASEPSGSEAETSSLPAEEPSSEESSSEPESTASDDSGSDAAEEAPTDLTDDDVLTALNGAEIDGVTLNAVAGSVLPDLDLAPDQLLEDQFGTLEITPEDCVEPVRSALVPGWVEPSVDEATVAADRVDTVLVSVRPLEDQEQAETAMDDYVDSVEGCDGGEMTVDSEGPLDVELAVDDISVPGASQAVTVTYSDDPYTTKDDIRSGRMVYGNSVVTIIHNIEYQVPADGERADYEQLLTEMTGILSGEPVAGPGSEV